MWRRGWPPQFPGRALRDRFTDEWQARVDALPQAKASKREQPRRAAAPGLLSLAKTTSQRLLLAGLVPSVAHVRETRLACEEVRAIGDELDQGLQGQWGVAA